MSGSPATRDPTTPNAAPRQLSAQPGTRDSPESGWRLRPAAVTLPSPRATFVNSLPSLDSIR